MKPFGYFRDGLFLGAVALYALNRWWLKAHVSNAFLDSYFNDLLLIAAALPLLLWAHRRLGLRSHDRPPTAGEIVLHLAAWSIVCELAGPLLFRNATGDPRDVLAYAVGAAAAGMWWNRPRPRNYRLSQSDRSLVA